MVGILEGKAWSQGNEMRSSFINPGWNDVGWEGCDRKFRGMMGNILVMDWDNEGEGEPEI